MEDSPKPSCDEQLFFRAQSGIGLAGDVWAAQRRPESIGRSGSGRGELPRFLAALERRCPGNCACTPLPQFPIQEENGLHWDLPHILSGVEKGLRDCAQIATEGIAAIGVDGWAVDYVRLDSAGKPIGNPFCYRDQRNVTAQAEVHARISADRLYELSGAQSITLNTLYQLRADTASGIDQKLPWVNLPEYVLHYLGGRRVSEYTNATHTELLGVQDQQWCEEIFTSAGLKMHAAPPVVKSGTDIGKVRGALAELPAFHYTRLIVPACHDTASAIAGIPAHGDDWAFISSGTWSLVGCVLDAPQTSARARASNFSNEGGVGGKTYFLKNVNGMWMIRQCLEHWEGPGHSRGTWIIYWRPAPNCPIPSIFCKSTNPIYCNPATWSRGSTHS